MSRPISDLEELLRNLRPTHHPGVVAFCSLPPGFSPGSSAYIGLFREADGVTVITPEEVAMSHGWTIVFRAAWITLAVHSDLQAVGLTAAVARALADAGISLQRGCSRESRSSFCSRREGRGCARRAHAFAGSRRVFT